MPSLRASPVGSLPPPRSLAAPPWGRPTGTASRRTPGPRRAQRGKSSPSPAAILRGDALTTAGAQASDAPTACHSCPASWAARANSYGGQWWSGLADVAALPNSPSPKER